MTILEYYKTFEVTTLIRKEYQDLIYVEIVVFSLIAGLIDRDGVTTMFEVNRLNTAENKLKSNGTMQYITRLANKGYLTKQREYNHFGKTYLSLTDKGLLLKSKFTRLLNTPLEG